MGLATSFIKQINCLLRKGSVRNIQSWQIPCSLHCFSCNVTLMMLLVSTSQPHQNLHRILQFRTSICPFGAFQSPFALLKPLQLENFTESYLRRYSLRSSFPHDILQRTHFLENLCAQGIVRTTFCAIFQNEPKPPGR